LDSVFVCLLSGELWLLLTKTTQALSTTGFPPPWKLGGRILSLASSSHRNKRKKKEPNEGKKKSANHKKAERRPGNTGSGEVRVGLCGAAQKKVENENK